MLVILKRRCCSIAHLRHVHVVYISRLSSQCVCRDGSDTSLTRLQDAKFQSDQRYRSTSSPIRTTTPPMDRRFHSTYERIFFRFIATFTVIRFFKSYDPNSPSRGKSQQSRRIDDRTQPPPVIRPVPNRATDDGGPTQTMHRRSRSPFLRSLVPHHPRSHHRHQTRMTR
jgi:hypothetical protein